MRLNRVSTRVVAVAVLYLSVSCCLAGEPVKVDESKKKSDFILQASQLVYLHAAAIDLWTTKACVFDRRQLGLREGNPLVPNNLAGASAVMVGTGVLTTWASYRLNREGRKWKARGILWAGIALHGWAAVHNSRLRHAAAR